MSRGIILHIFVWDRKFVLPFRDLIHERFAYGRHKFAVIGKVAQDVMAPSAETAVYPTLFRNFFALSAVLHRAEKIILHGLFNNHLLNILALQPWLLKKCYWVMWGGDLYVHEASPMNWRWKKNEVIRHFVIRRIGYLVGYVPGDVELARRWYGAKGKFLECLMYRSNTFKPVELPEARHTVTTILVGNSADRNNNHREILEQLSKLEDQNFRLICPLSYGDHSYAESVAAEGIKLFGDRFVPLFDFIPYQDYQTMLAQVDIAVFGHRRQQGMGNTIALLGLGKKVYMRADVSSSSLLKDLGFDIGSLSEFNLRPLDADSIRANKTLAATYFSEERLVAQLSAIFET